MRPHCIHTIHVYIVSRSKSLVSWCCEVLNTSIRLICTYRILCSLSVLSFLSFYPHFFFFFVFFFKIIIFFFFHSSLIAFHFFLSFFLAEMGLVVRCFMGALWATGGLLTVGGAVVTTFNPPAGYAMMQAGASTLGCLPEVEAVVLPIEAVTTVATGGAV